MHPACKECRGACCELITFSYKADETLDQYFQVRAKKTDLGYSFESICPKLKDGKCSIYENRPHICDVYKVGCDACKNAIKLRRSPKQQKKILSLLDDNS